MSTPNVMYHILISLLSSDIQICDHESVQLNMSRWKTAWRWHHFPVPALIDIFFQNFRRYRILNTFTDGWKWMKWERNLVNSFGCHQKILDDYTDCSLVAVWKRFVCSFSHESPLIVFKFAFDDFVVEFFELLRNFDLRKWLVQSTNIQITDLFRQNPSFYEWKWHFGYHIKWSRKYITNIYPAPCSTPIFNLKSTEFKLAGFHFKTISHWPGIYGWVAQCKRKLEEQFQRVGSIKKRLILESNSHQRMVERWDHLVHGQGTWWTFLQATSSLVSNPRTTFHAH